ncbi:MAG: HAMP domain-containing sensor histidine kinase [Pseudomonadota bacterium]
MKTLLRSLIPTTAPAIWQVEGDELVVVVNLKNKVTALTGALGPDGPALARGQSIFTLVDGAAHDDLAAALNRLRRADMAQAGTAAPLVITLKGETCKRAVRLQRAGGEQIRLHLGPVLSETAPMPSNNAAATACADTAIAAPDLADLSHEMKTPLNAIMGFADTMREETFGPLGDDRYRDYVNDIYRSGQHLMGLITSILDLAREETTGEAKTSLTHLETLLDETVAMVSPALAASGLRLRVECDRDLPELMLDQQAVRQIVLNLLTNAIKYTSDGEIRLLATLDRDADHLVMTVRDPGIGMNTDQLEGLGARFTEVQADGVRGAAGHGLGLNLAHRLAEKCGGSLTFSSAPGEGMVARLVLPAQGADQREDNSVAPSTLTQSGRPVALVTQMERIERFRERLQTARKSDAA